MTQLATPPIATTTDPAPARVPPDAGLVRLGPDSGTARPRRYSFALRMALPATIFGLWWALTGTGTVQPTTLSTPPATWDAFVYLLRQQDLVGDIGVSVRRAALGLALGAGIGVMLGIVVGLSRLGEEVFDASLQMLRMVPYPAVIFLFIVWFGIGETAKVLLIGLATMFPMYLNTSKRRAQRGSPRRRGGPQLRVTRLAFGAAGRRPARHAVHPHRAAVLRGYLGHRARVHRASGPTRASATS